MSWYKKGLRFKCTQCGACCTGTPGFVWITDEEMEEMAKGLGISKKMFMKQCTRFVHGRYALLEDPNTYDCLFLKENKCLLYHSRPKQCRSFPWWKSHLSSRHAWKQAAKECEGIDHPDAPLVPLEEIENQ